MPIEVRHVQLARSTFLAELSRDGITRPSHVTAQEWNMGYIEALLTLAAVAALASMGKPLVIEKLQVTVTNTRNDLFRRIGLPLDDDAN